MTRPKYTGNSEIIDTPVAELAADVFGKCEKCGKVTAAPKQHSCGGLRLGSARDAEERKWRRDADEGDPDDAVVIREASRSDAAYHKQYGVDQADEYGFAPDGGDVDGDVYPACAVAEHCEETTWKTTTRGAAQDRGNFPCAHCFNDTLMQVAHERAGVDPRTN